MNLLTAQTGTDNGVYKRLQGTRRIVVQTQGIGTGTVQIYGYNPATPDEAKPTDSTDHGQIGSDITADGQVEITGERVWIKAKKSSAGNSTATTVTITGVTSGQG